MQVTAKTAAEVQNHAFFLRMLSSITAPSPYPETSTIACLLAVNLLVTNRYCTSKPSVLRSWAHHLPALEESRGCSKQFTIGSYEGGLFQIGEVTCVC